MMLTKNHDQLAAEVKAHIDADAVVQGEYWDGSKGCFIGCLAHSDDATVLQERFGLPLSLVKICEAIFERLPAEEAKAFFAAIPDAVGHDGKDLSLVRWHFLAAELRALLKVPAEIQAVIDTAIEGMDRLARGEDWPYAADAASAAYAVAYAASAAADAAADVAYAVASAADAAADGDANAAADAAWEFASAADAAAAAAVKRQRDTVLKLIAEAPYQMERKDG